ncbi:MAG TPA: hypothetical protein VF519_00180 [Mycobacteriales bacterium]|jgi:hypothetical protein
MKTKRLVLRSESVRELSVGELESVAGGVTLTCFSCLDYISCNPVACLPTFDGRCIQ